ncbi:MAG: hypothetical protein COV69_03220 [Parcubacteria group bacterium CG11_big_fil_rev_8_21_14_0_20_39_14]|nr:MAG: hypothetical protein COV69_03220 [Parcubacteria group bacterium CG11_big_fil_rev_8_21_14_0_20_39_14]PIS34950.1 MAG: hypothetical protein COT36_04945 [Parcubacteria group bacterium CG08_land_8_20_14_0_20_38_56]
MKQIPEFLKKYFWDVDFRSIDFQKDEGYVAERLLEYGDPKALSWLLKNVKRETIKKILFEERALSPKSANFWAVFFGWPHNKILCLKKSYLKMRKSHWPY